MGAEDCDVYLTAFYTVLQSRKLVPKYNSSDVMTTSPVAICVHPR